MLHDASRWTLAYGLIGVVYAALVIFPNLPELEIKVRSTGRYNVAGFLLAVLFAFLWAAALWPIGVLRRLVWWSL